jgi:hypothetical protein
MRNHSSVNQSITISVNAFRFRLNPSFWKDLVKCASTVMVDDNYAAILIPVANAETVVTITHTCRRRNHLH